MMSRSARRIRRTSPVTLGAIFAAGVVLVGLFAFNRAEILTRLEPGDTMTADFARDYRVREFVTEVKVVGVPVGTVTTVERRPRGPVSVGMKLDRGVLDKLGTEPSARIRPATMLGGKYYVELVPGGRRGSPSGPIPVRRTCIAVELDSTVSALQPDAVRGARRFVGEVDATLRAGGTDALRGVVHEAPDSLRPAEKVLDASTGNRPDTLKRLVDGLDDTALQLTEQDGQLASIVKSFHTTAGVLETRRDALARTVAQLPATLRSTRSGLRSLGGTLDTLTTTAHRARPAVREVGPLLAALDPALVKARPFARDLRALLVDTQPLLHELVPTADSARQVLDNVRGPVLDRVKGPILHALNTPFVGSGRYKGSRSPYRLYQDIGYAMTNADRISALTDRNGATLSIQVGFNPGAVRGVPGTPSEDDIFRRLMGLEEAPK